MKETYIRIRVAQKFKDDFKKFLGKNSMTKFIENAITEGMHNAKKTK